MDTKNSGSSNVKTTSSADRAATNTTSTSVDVPNSNIVETDSMGGTDVRTVDMSGTNLPNATNAKTPEERAQDVRIVDGTTRDSSAPNTPVPNEVVSGNPVSTDSKLAAKTDTAPKLPTVKVRLLGNHTHEGISYEKGDIVDVDEQSAKYLETAENGVRV